jgi:hypothetical protein
VLSGPGVPFMSTAQDIDENKVNEIKYIDKQSVILNFQNNLANIPNTPILRLSTFWNYTILDVR